MVLKDFRNRYKNSAMGLVCNGEILYLSNHYTNFKYIWCISYPDIFMWQCENIRPRQELIKHNSFSIRLIRLIRTDRTQFLSYSSKLASSGPFLLSEGKIVGNGGPN